MRLVSLSLAVLLGCGCADDSDTDPFGDPPDEDPASITRDNVQAYAGLSAPAMFGSALVPYLIAGLDSTDGQSTCPAVTENGNTTVAEGDCVNADGQKILGRATYVVNGGETTLTYEGFGFEEASGCPSAPTRLVYDGSLHTVENPAGGGSFDVDIELTTEAAATSCQVFSSSATIQYSGSVSSTGTPTDATATSGKWNGSGSYWSSVQGKVHTETVDELVDSDICAYEAASGKTTITAGDDVLVVTYDGAGDCDEARTVRVQLDGEDLGELSNIACTVAMPSRTRTAAPFFVALGLLVTLGRRRRSSC